MGVGPAWMGGLDGRPGWPRHRVTELAVLICGPRNKACLGCVRTDVYELHGRTAGKPRLPTVRHTHAGRAIRLHLEGGYLGLACSSSVHEDVSQEAENRIPR